MWKGQTLAFLAVKYVAQDIACVGELGNDRSLGLARQGVGFYCFDFLNERHLTREQRCKTPDVALLTLTEVLRLANIDRRLGIWISYDVDRVDPVVLQDCH